MEIATQEGWTPEQPVEQPVSVRTMSNDEYNNLLWPLVSRGIAFDLAIPGCLIARVTWNGGEAVDAVMWNGDRMRLQLPVEPVSTSIVTPYAQPVTVDATLMVGEKVSVLVAWF